MVKFPFLLTLSTFLLCISSCKRANKDEIPEYLNRADISDAVGLYAKTDPDTYETLKYKILADGTVQEISLYSNSVLLDLNYNFDQFINVNEEYVIFRSGNGPMYLVRKSDGALRNINSPYYIDVYAIRQFQDKKSIYFGMTEDIIKLTINDINDVTFESIPTGNTELQGVTDFAIDKNGNLVSSYWSDSFTRFRKKDGTFHTINSSSLYLINGFDDNLYYATRLTNDYFKSTLNNIYRITPEPFNASTPYNANLSQNSNISILLNSTDRPLPIKNKSKLLVKNYPSCSSCSNVELVEIYNPTHTKNNFRVSDYSLTSFIDFRTSDDYIFLCGNNASGSTEIIKIDSDTHIGTSVFSTNEITVETIRIDRNEGIYLFGTKNGKKVLAKVTSSTSYQLLDDDIDDYYFDVDKSLTLF